MLRHLEHKTKPRCTTCNVYSIKTYLNHNLDLKNKKSEHLHGGRGDQMSEWAKKTCFFHSFGEQSGHIMQKNASYECNIYKCLVSKQFVLKKV